MTDSTDFQTAAMDMLEATSRTFFIPITHLPEGLQEAVSSAYLCMRAIDEIEDHPQLEDNLKIQLLRQVAEHVQDAVRHDRLRAVLHSCQDRLPEVTLKLLDWIELCPVSARPIMLASIVTMASGMAEWVSRDFRIRDKDDLDNYTYYVAGLVGVMLSDLWAWYDRIETDRHLAIGFGRGLQAVNMIRNRAEDLQRGTDFFPDGWEVEDMFAYARQNLDLAEAYIRQIKSAAILDFCRIPLALAHATLDAIESGGEKLGREAVVDIVSRVSSKM